MIRSTLLQLLALLMMFWIPQIQAQTETVGKIDYSFGHSGKKVIQSNSKNSDEGRQAMLLQPDEKIILTGYINQQDITGFNIYRMHNAGDIDTTFGTQGKVHIAIKGQANALALQPDGKILVAGYQIRGKFQDIIVVRLLPDGTIDEEFGVQGSVRVSFGGFATVAGIQILENGKIIVAGDSYKESWNGRQFAIASLLPNGQFDNHFGKGGKLTLDVGKYATCEDIAIQHDGKILLIGNSKVNEFHDFVLLRLYRDGREDHSFGTAGVQRYHIGKENDYAKTVEVLPSRKILVAGQAKSMTSGEFEMIVMRLHLDGSLDNGFAKKGIHTIHAGGASYPSDIAIQKDGNILIAGTADYKYTVARLNHRGMTDLSFGKNGIKQMKKMGGHSTDYTGDLAIQDDGRILLSGVCSSKFTLTRLQGNPYLRGLDDMLAFEYDGTKVPERNYAKIHVAPGFNIKAWLKQDAMITSNGASRGGKQSIYDDVGSYKQKLMLNHGHFKIGERCKVFIVRDSEDKIHYYVNRKYAKSIVK